MEKPEERRKSSYKEKVMGINMDTCMMDGGRNRR